MKKTYLPPTLRALRVSATTLLTVSSLAKPGTVVDLDENEDAAGWSKSFWGLAEDDSPSFGSEN